MVYGFIMCCSYSGGPVILAGQFKHEVYSGHVFTCVQSGGLNIY